MTKWNVAQFDPFQAHDSCDVQMFFNVGTRTTPHSEKGGDCRHQGRGPRMRAWIAAAKLQEQCIQLDAATVHAATHSARTD